MSYMTTNFTSDIVANEIYTDNSNQKQLLSRESASDVESDDTSSVVSSCASSHNDVVCNDPNSRRNFDCIEKIEPSDTRIGTACIENSTRVTLGTVFNGPVVIKHYRADCDNMKTNITQRNSKDPLKTSKYVNFTHGKIINSMLQVQE